MKVKVSEVQEKPPKHDEDEDDGDAEQWAWDDVSGARLDPQAVHEARQEEIISGMSMDAIEEHKEGEQDCTFDKDANIKSL